MAKSWKSTKFTGQLPLWRPDSDWRPPKVSELPSWKGIERIGLDTETKDPTLTTLGPGVRRGGQIVGISFAIEDGPAFYLPMRHHGGDNLDPVHVMAYMRDQARDYTGTICGANLGYDLDFLAEDGVVFRNASFKDIQVAEPLIDENQLSYSLDTLAKKYGFMGKEEDLLREAAKSYNIDPKKDMWQLPARFVGPYAEPDAWLPLKILRKQERVIDDQDIWDIYRLECRVLPVLVKMRRRGIRIDFDQLDKVEKFTRVKEQEHLDRIFHETGVRINLDEINKTKLVVAALDVAGVPYGRTEPSQKHPNGQASVKKEFLEPNKSHPVVNAILEARSYNKVRNTFVRSIRDHQVNGRVHCTFNQLRRQDDNSDEVKGAGPGRLSCVPKATSEILTADGWKFWNQLSVGESVMGFNILTGEYEWTTLRAVHDAGVAPVGYIKIKRGHYPCRDRDSFLCTGEHRWIIDHPTISGFTYSHNSNRGIRNLLLPTKQMPAPETSILTEDQAFVLGWYLTDGWKRKSERMINQSMCVAVVKKSSVDQLVARIHEYGIEKHTTHRTYLRQLNYNDHKRTVHYFYFKSEYFEPIYQVISTTDPAELVLKLSNRARQSMLSAMLEGDGSRRRGAARYDKFGALEHHQKQTWQYFTTLAVACGQPYTTHNTITTAGQPFLNFTLTRDKIQSNKNHRWSPIREEDTWCPETGLGTWVMRQGTNICVTGNSCDPNLQQQPSRHPLLGKMWRSIYLPDEGGQWAALDYCFSSDTEVLTEKGFVPFPELPRDVAVAQYFPDGSITYDTPTAYQEVPYSGDMYHIHGERQVDMLVSPNHRCALLRPSGQLLFQRAEEDFRGNKLIPQCGVLAGNVALPESVVRQAAVIQADGSFRTSHYRVFLGKSRKISRLQNILGGGPDYVCKTKAAGHAFKLDLNPLVHPGSQKVFRRDKLLALRPYLRELFLEELLHWDGSISRRVYTTTVKENADIVQEVAALTGYRANLSQKPQPGGRKDLYVVSLNHKPGTYLKTITKNTVPYEGTIYCVTMPAGTVVVRRNGRVAVTGNSQQEPRLFIHYAHIAGCAGTQAAVDGFHAGLDWHDMTTKMAFDLDKATADPKLFKAQRTRAKIIFLGLIYGMGGAKLCRQLGFTTEIINIRGAEREVAGPEGRAFLEEFNRKLPFLNDIKNRVERVAWNRRYIRTILGRHIHYTPGAGMERKALNNLIQGSAADQTKLAMVLMDENNFRIQLQIHDEVDTTVYDEKTAKDMAEIMSTCVPLVVPSKVDIEIGANWGDSME